MRVAKTQALNVAGAMSGTSADGIDVAITRISTSGQKINLRLLAHDSFPFPPALRRALLQAQDARAVSVATLARLRTRLGLEYAHAISATLQKHAVRIDLAGCHGQTIYHQGNAALYLGKRLATSWQLLDPAPIAEKLRVPVVSDFRTADIAAGGQGAPLVALLDYEFFRGTKQHRLLQNLGGIGNMTVLPSSVALRDVVAFDTGPANMLIDALMRQLYGRTFDRDGAIAARGIALDEVVAQTLRLSFFRKAPPKTAGREQFGEKFAADFLRRCRQHSKRSQDAVATATLLTAASLRLAIDKFVRPATPLGNFELVVSGGGSRNATLMRLIAEQTAHLDCTPRTSDDLGMSSSAKEAAAFALLAWKTWHRLPGNVPSATGARRPVVLGRISYV
jgi:anhydro-N-acetylmuramic acid kinase